LPSQFYEVFKGRTDKIGLATTFSTTRDSEEAILEDVQSHLNGTCRLGFYNLLPNSTSPWAIIEREDHGSQRVENPGEKSLEIVQLLNAEGIPAYRELSKSHDGNAYHIWIFFDSPISAETVHVSLNAFLATALGIRPEVFPKGHDGKTIGNFVWLPLFGGTDKWGEGIHEGRTVFVDNSGTAYADQWKFFDTIERVTAGQFDAFINEYRLPVKEHSKQKAGAYFDPAGVDLAKVRECSFMKHCEEHADNLAEPLWYGWITNAIRCTGGREYIHAHSKKYPQYSRHETDKKIAHALNDAGPMTHASIAELGFTCNCPSKFKAPITRATYIDIASEVDRIKAMKNVEDQGEAIKRLIAY
jgi:hypothetical protein